MNEIVAADINEISKKILGLLEGQDIKDEVLGRYILESETAESSSFVDMLISMIVHKKQHGNIKLLSSVTVSPSQLKLGWTDDITEKRWTIDIIKLKDINCQHIKDLFTNQHGRAILGRAMEGVINNYE